MISNVASYKTIDTSTGVYSLARKNGAQMQQ